MHQHNDPNGKNSCGTDYRDNGAVDVTVTHFLCDILNKIYNAQKDTDSTNKQNQEGTRITKVISTYAIFIDMNTSHEPSATGKSYT